LECIPRDEYFLDERTIQLEHLKAIIRTIADIDQIVVGYHHGVNGIVETFRRGSLNELRARGEFVAVVGLLAVGAPMPLVFAGVRIKNDDAVIKVPVSHEQLVCLRVYKQTGRTSEVLRVV